MEDLKYSGSKDPLHKASLLNTMLICYLNFDPVWLQGEDVCSGFQLIYSGLRAEMIMQSKPTQTWSVSRAILKKCQDKDKSWGV